jgi:hypothetical protein
VAWQSSAPHVDGAGNNSFAVMARAHNVLGGLVVRIVVSFRLVWLFVAAASVVMVTPPPRLLGDQDCSLGSSVLPPMVRSQFDVRLELRSFTTAAGQCGRQHPWRR